MGGLHVIGVTKEEADRVKSQLSVLQRSEISNPPSHGARIVRSFSPPTPLFVLSKLLFVLCEMGYLQSKIEGRLT